MLWLASSSDYNFFFPHVWFRFPPLLLFYFLQFLKFLLYDIINILLWLYLKSISNKIEVFLWYLSSFLVGADPRLRLFIGIEILCVYLRLQIRHKRRFHTPYLRPIYVPKPFVCFYLLSAFSTQPDVMMGQQPRDEIDNFKRHLDFRWEI